MKRFWILAAVSLVIVLICASRLLEERSEIVTEENEIDARWAQLDSDMKEYAASVSNLLDLIGIHAPPEILTEATNALHAFSDARTKQDKMTADQRLSKAAGQLLSLRADQSQRDELAREENDIDVDRRDYNDAITRYNTNIELFPKNVAATIFGYRRDDQYFRAAEKAF